MTVTESPSLPNGVNVEALLGAREAFKTDTSLTQFQWRARNEWVNGTHSRTVIDDFTGIGGPQAHKAPVAHDADHPEIFAAEDNGSTPVEFVLHALASCLTGGIASVAANRGVTLNSVSSTIEGDMDLQGILGMDRNVRNGFSCVRVRFEIDADADADAIRSLVAQSQKRSAVYDILTGKVPVEIDVVAK
ncbi:MAG: OsmC family protein [Acidimicrobiia bacterium]|nr:OsmC family protein [Acidimicrobiia bacterium]